MIDISPLQADPSGNEAADCIAAMHAACIETGFFVVLGHGLDDEIISLFAGVRRFFELPQAAKERTPRVNRYGYIPHRPSAIDISRASDNVEYLDIGLHAEVDVPAVAGLEPAVRRYQQAAISVAMTVLGALAAALGAQPEFFAKTMVNPQCRLRFLHYPAVQPDSHGLLPVPNPPHTDYGLITLLATDGIPGLEVKPVDSEWIPVEAPEGSLVINLGDMLARWSNDRYRSTPHRVVGPAAGDRVSIPFFINPDPGTVVDCIPSCITEGRPQRYDQITAGTFLTQRIDGSTEPYVDPYEGPARQANASPAPGYDGATS